MTEKFQGQTSFKLDGKIVFFNEGETIFDVSQRSNSEIPTLCYDPRLEPFGSCRLCVVEVEGIRNPVASCTTPAQSNMVVKTSTATLNKHRKVLLEMVASENRQIDVDPLSGFASQELSTLIDRYNARTGRFGGKKSGKIHPTDENPFILRDYEQCISCNRCVRVCAEQEGDFAISAMGRGFSKQITTEFNSELRDSSCTFCGQCVQTCPTGALSDKKALRAVEINKPIKKTRSVCPYCGVGCSVDLLTKENELVGIQPAMDGPANEGALCVKGQFAFDFVHHPDRLRNPLVRDEEGILRETDWDTALDKAAEGFRNSYHKYGRHSIYGVASGRTPSEADYCMQKFVRRGYGTHYIDNCSRA